MAHGSASCFLILSSSQNTVVPLLLRADRYLDLWAVELVKEVHTLQILFSLFINPFQISLLSSSVNHLKANVKSAADLLSLPSTVEGLQKVSAMFGHYLMLELRVHFENLAFDISYSKIRVWSIPLCPVEFKTTLLVGTLIFNRLLYGLYSLSPFVCLCSQVALLGPPC